MTQANLMAIKSLLIRTARYYGQQLDDFAVRAYAADLARLDARDVERALNHLRMDPKRRWVPLPAEVLAFLSPPVSRDAQAMEIAGRIQKTIGAVGQYRAEMAKDRLGPMAWAVVERLGGWQSVCTVTANQRGTFYAQARDTAKACLELSHAQNPCLEAGVALPELEAPKRQSAPTPIGQLIRQGGALALS